MDFKQVINKIVLEHKNYKSKYLSNQCSLCRAKGNTYTFICDVRKSELFRYWYLVKNVLTLHKIENIFITLCVKCHFYFHILDELPDDIFIEWKCSNFYNNMAGTGNIES